MRQETRDQYCGIGPYRPQWLQRFANVKMFTLFSCLVVGIQGMYLGYVISVLTTIEKRFQIASSKSGALLSIYDIGHAMSVLIIGHFGAYLHQPRWIAIGSIISSLACFGIALPHFIFDSPQDLIIEGQNSTTFDLPLCEMARVNGSDSCNGNEHPTNSAYIMLGVFQALAGFGSCAFTTLTYVYIDNNCSKKQTPFYLGIVTTMWGYGPAAGFGLGATMTQIYHTLGDPPFGITQTNPAWIGAWWLGLIICSVLYIIIGVPFLLFPMSLRSSNRSDTSRYRVETDLLALPDLRQASDYVKMRERQKFVKSIIWAAKQLAALPLEVLRLLKNPMFTTMTLFWISDAYVVGGYFTFLPKYLEVQFGESSSMANIWSALVSVFGYATAIGVGGKILSYFNPKPSTALLLVFIVTVHEVFVNLLLTTVGCPTTPVNGVNSLSYQNLTSPVCQADCICDPSNYYPVCSSGETYFSPCHAGCTGVNPSDSIMLTGCSCAPNASVSVGSCPKQCGNRLVIYLIGGFSGAFVSALFDMATYTTMIWAVPVDKKPITIALANFLCSVFGFMPSQVVFGALIDTACSFWSSTACSNGGYCLLYDNTTFRVRFHLATTAFLIAAAVSVLVGWFFSRDFKFVKEDEDEKDWTDLQSFVFSVEEDEDRL